MSDDALRELREVQAYFRLPSVGLVEKDLHVVRAIAALAAIDAKPFALIFGGGTALARAHRIVRRMSEDVDFKIVPKPAMPLSRSALRHQLDGLRRRVSRALWDAGFTFDPADKSVAWARDEGRYAVWHLPYRSESGAGEGLRPAIQIEMSYAPLRRKSVALPVSSFVAEAYGRPSEIAELACVSITETAAEKLVSLTRRTAMEMAGASRDPDPTLVRHIYDLHMMHPLVDTAEVASLARIIAEADARQFAGQYPTYAADIAGETRKALDALRSNPVHRARFEQFTAAMVYGEQLAFDEALATVAEMVRIWLAE